MDSSFPEGEAATLTLDVKAPKELTLSLRRPSWAGDGFAIRINGQADRRGVATRLVCRRHAHVEDW